MSQSGTPLHRLEQAVGEKTGKEDVTVFVGDVIDCGGGTADLKVMRPGQAVTMPASQVRKLFAGVKGARLQQQQQSAEELIRQQTEELERLKAEANALKKEGAA